MSSSQSSLPAAALRLDVVSVITCVCQISDVDFLDSILSLDLGEEVAHILLKVR